MNDDDLGRGQLAWSADRWQKLDDLAGTTVGENVILRNLVEHRDDIGAHSARIAGRNKDVVPISSDAFQFNMEEEEDEDLLRRIRLAAQELAAREDQAVLAVMKGAVQMDEEIDYKSFSKAKNQLKSVQHGLAAVVSSDVLTTLETEEVGVKSGRDVVEQLLGAQVTQSNALDNSDVEAVVLQASPPAYRMVRGSVPQVRVVRVENGSEVTLRLEERVAIGELEPNRVIGIVSAKKAHERTPGREHGGERIEFGDFPGRGRSMRADSPTEHDTGA